MLYRIMNLRPQFYIGGQVDGKTRLNLHRCTSIQDYISELYGSLKLTRHLDKGTYSAPDLGLFTRALASKCHEAIVVNKFL